MTASFWETGFAVIPNLVAPDQLAFVRAAMDLAERLGSLHIADNAVQQGSHNQYKPLAGELILQNVRSRLEQIVDRPLLPTYSFIRIYEAGMALKVHRDRPACEISVSVPIHSDPASHDWPLRVTDLGGMDHAPPQPPGTGLLYQGCRVKHWREPLVGARQYQLFLHYVLADGDHAALAGDCKHG
jgi:hypothetical protein